MDELEVRSDSNEHTGLFETKQQNHEVPAQQQSHPDYITSTILHIDEVANKIIKDNPMIFKVKILPILTSVELENLELKNKHIFIDAIASQPYYCISNRVFPFNRLINIGGKSVYDNHKFVSNLNQLSAEMERENYSSIYFLINYKTDEKSLNKLTKIMIKIKIIYSVTVALLPIKPSKLHNEGKEIELVKQRSSYCEVDSLKTYLPNNVYRCETIIIDGGDEFAEDLSIYMDLLIRKALIASKVTNYYLTDTRLNCKQILTMPELSYPDDEGLVYITSCFPMGCRYEKPNETNAKQPSMQERITKLIYMVNYLLDIVLHVMKNKFSIMVDKIINIIMPHENNMNNENERV